MKKILSTITGILILITLSTITLGLILYNQLIESDLGTTEYKCVSNCNNISTGNIYIQKFHKVRENVIEICGYEDSYSISECTFCRLNSDTRIQCLDRLKLAIQTTFNNTILVNYKPVYETIYKDSPILKLKYNQKTKQWE